MSSPRLSMRARAAVSVRDRIKFFTSASQPLESDEAAQIIRQPKERRSFVKGRLSYRASHGGRTHTAAKEPALCASEESQQQSDRSARRSHGSTRWSRGSPGPQRSCGSGPTPLSSYSSTAINLSTCGHTAPPPPPIVDAVPVHSVSSNGTRAAAVACAENGGSRNAAHPSAKPSAPSTSVNGGGAARSGREGISAAPNEGAVVLIRMLRCLNQALREENRTLKAELSDHARPRSREGEAELVSEYEEYYQQLLAMKSETGGGGSMVEESNRTQAELQEMGQIRKNLYDRLLRMSDASLFAQAQKLARVVANEEKTFSEVEQRLASHVCSKVLDWMDLSANKRLLKIRELAEKEMAAELHQRRLRKQARQRAKVEDLNAKAYDGVTMSLQARLSAFQEIGDEKARLLQLLLMSPSAVMKLGRADWTRYTHTSGLSQDEVRALTHKLVEVEAFLGTDEGSSVPRVRQMQVKELLVRLQKQVASFPASVIAEIEALYNITDHTADPFDSDLDSDLEGEGEENLLLGDVS
ncbi:hypothetical protein AB1Y20_001911 [Prymnesium parvum]|uniref:DUF4200 domain-containing protein n=1 Tax=Prymnesium parvum TaxID=97485 RepID=A0AB34J7L3_PRYPA